MLKILLPLAPLVLGKNNIMLMTSLTALMMYLAGTLKDYNTPLMLNNNMMMDTLSYIMILLTLMTTLLITLSSSNKNKIITNLMLILVILTINFSTSNMLMFYITFEMVLIPTFIMVTMTGYQPERLQASIYLLMYTIFASLPLLLSISMFKFHSMVFMEKISFYFNTPIFLILAFLVKMPMFFTHLWLPKAHVEAPLEGSMILAAVLLKLGGYGLIRFIPLIFSKIYSISFYLMSISLLGALMTSTNCVRQKDLKSLIAYSSIAHMSIVLASLMTLNKLGMKGAVMMMIAHGLASSALFLLVNIVYLKYHSRSIILLSGLINSFPNISFWWFMFTLMNIAAPPSINLASEILMMMSVSIWSMKSLIPIGWTMLLTTIFSVSLFINITHNKTEVKITETSKNKTFLSLTMHMSPLILLILKMDIMMLFISLMKRWFVVSLFLMMFYTSIFMFVVSLPFLMTALSMFFKNFSITLESCILSIPPLDFPLNVNLDWISCLFIFTVMFISANILMFSINYIPPKEHKKFMMLMLAFVASMLMLILSDNLIFILLGWDGLGLTSYILVIYYQNAPSAASGSITIFSNRLGDIFILISISMTLHTPNWSFPSNENFLLITTLLISLAAFSKSAQFPFSAWLPAAMAAPTPISALVHSSTLVTAGVYLLIRTLPSSHPQTMTLIMLASSATIMYSSMSACWENDMKKIIALSTLSQIAVMMYAISINSMTLAFLHLIIHAMFKSLMFLSAGVMIHNSSYQDMRHMGSIMSNHPLTPSALGVTSLALMGAPFMSGFFSKDMIMEMMLTSNLMTWSSMAMMLSLGMTAVYSSRMVLNSMQLYMKSSPNLNTHPYGFMEASLIIMIPTSIMLGLLMSWLITPVQSFIMPNYFKFTISLMLISGVTLGLVLSFKSKKFTASGNAGISLWFMHFLSTNLLVTMTPPMKTFMLNDKTWKEMYGPAYLFSQNKILSLMTNKILNHLLFILMSSSILLALLFIML